MSQPSHCFSFLFLTGKGFCFFLKSYFYHVVFKTLQSQPETKPLLKLLPHPNPFWSEHIESKDSGVLFMKFTFEAVKCLALLKKEILIVQINIAAVKWYSWFKILQTGAMYALLSTFQSFSSKCYPAVLHTLPPSLLPMEAIELKSKEKSA